TVLSPAPPRPAAIESPRANGKPTATPARDGGRTPCSPVAFPSLRGPRPGRLEGPARRLPVGSDDARDVAVRAAGRAVPAGLLPRRRQPVLDQLLPAQGPRESRSVREALTLEVFLAINETYHALETYETRGMPDLPAFRDALPATQKGLFTILGAIDHTFTRDETWRFLKLGEALERLFRTTLVLRVKLPALLAAESRIDLPLYCTQWRTLLRTLSSLENYRRRYGARLVPQLVIAFLLFDPNSPRSLRYGVAALKECLEVIAGPGNLTAPGRLVGRLLADFCYDEEELMRRPDFAVVLDHVAAELSKMHDTLATQYFVT